MTDIFQIEPSLQDYWFCFLVLNMVIILSYKKIDKLKPNKLNWFIALLFCVFFAKWETDYFSYNRGFYLLSEEYRDPLYYYIKFFSFGSYELWRTIVWGGALILFNKTCKRLNISANILMYIFSVFFLMTFSYARASLAMASYFYGLSCIVCSPKKIKLGLFFVLFSYFAHRSSLLLIVMLPLIYMRFNKKRMLLFLLLSPILMLLMNKALIILNAGTISDDSVISGFTDAAQHYAYYNRKDLAINWKFELVTKLRNYSFYILYAYISYRLIKLKFNVDEGIKRFFSISTILIYISSLFIFNTGAVGMTDIIGQRYLYFLGIPLCLLLSYLIQNGYCTKKMMNILVFLAFVYIEGWLLGKIASLGYF